MVHVKKNLYANYYTISIGKSYFYRLILQKIKINIGIAAMYRLPSLSKYDFNDNINNLFIS